MHVQLSARHFWIAAGILLFLLWGHYYGPFYANNQWKRHRWASEVCKSEGKPVEYCAMRTQITGSSEQAFFDIDLETGALRRIK